MRNIIPYNYRPDALRTFSLSWNGTPTNISAVDLEGCFPSNPAVLESPFMGQELYCREPGSKAFGMVQAILNVKHHNSGVYLEKGYDQDIMAIRSNALASPTPTSTPVAPGNITANLLEVMIAPGPGAPAPSPSPMLKSLTGIPLVQHRNAHD
ncbi:hypothetical protein BDV93DRAFT_561054 [Ceratobasidium sp. AG-I]|nr:hypothetical protein BDV93DRAFT_561054 [Ceratobasidium sp. AG-I]